MNKLKNFTLLRENKLFALGSKFLILCLIVLVGLLVYLTGGTTSFVHLMYIPILLTVVIYGFKASIISSIVGGLVLGPFMPLHVSNQIMQETSSWVFRIIMFIIIAFFVDILYKDVKRYYEMQKELAYHDIITGYPNANKFKDDFNYMINNNNSSISLTLIEFTNKDMINQYLNYNTAQAAFMNLLNLASNVFSDSKVYSVTPNQFSIIFKDMDHLKTSERVCQFIEMLNEPMHVNTLPISVIVKGSIVSYPYHGKDTDDLMQKLQKSLGHPVYQKNNVSIYDDNFEVKRKEYYNTLVFLYYLLKKDMFELAYQPKICLADQEVIGVEALLRLRDNSIKKLSIGTLINIAEDAGFINEITKWVIKTSIGQIKEWKDNGLDVCVSINLSAHDIMDNSIVEYTKAILEQYNIESNRIEFELTERSIISDFNKAYETLSKFRELGIKISLDDYGIGHNSLVHLVNNTFPYDYIKIDKEFIDNIEKDQNQSLIKGIIDTAHVLRTRVIAEGVESLEQVKVLEDIGCDIIQGYYFSKPIPAKDIISFMEETKDYCLNNG